MASPRDRTPSWALAVIIVVAILVGLLTPNIHPTWLAWLVAGIAVVAAVLIIWLVRELLHRRSAR